MINYPWAAFSDPGTGSRCSQGPSISSSSQLRSSDPSLQSGSPLHTRCCLIQRPKVHRYRQSLICPSENFFGSLHGLCCFPPISRGQQKSRWVLNPVLFHWELAFPCSLGEVFLCNLEQAQLGVHASHSLGLPWDGNQAEVTSLT